MAYQGVVFPILVGVGLAVAAMFYFLSTGDLHAPQSNRPRDNGGPAQHLRGPLTNSWEQSSNRNNKPKRKRSVQAEQTTCTVCCEELKSDMKTLPCEHKFHEWCIGRWFKEQKNCPLCRQSTTV